MVAGEKTVNHIIKTSKVFPKPAPLSNILGSNGTLAAGEIRSENFYKGVNYLLKNNHNFDEDYYTAVGFPKVFYLKYHGYAKYFPLLALSKIKNQISKNSIKPT